MYSMLPFASLARKHIKIIQEPDGLVVKCSGTAGKPIPKQKNTAKRNKKPLVYGTADMTSPYL